jgi:hypothetical protein
MSGVVVSFAALRTARMLKDNAPPGQIDAFIAQMAGLARRQGDAARAAFWQEVAALVEQPPMSLSRSDRRRRSGAAR